MVLTVLQHVQQRDLTARLFGIKSSTLERVVTNSVKIISDHLYEKCVQRLEKKWPMSRCRLELELFPRFDFARYVTDFIFSQNSRPAENISEEKCTFPESTNCTGTRWRRPFCHPDWQLDSPLNTLLLLQIRNYLGKIRHFTKKCQKKAIRDVEHDENCLLQQYSSD